MEDLEDLHYLSQNLHYAIHQVKMGTQPLSFYTELENKALETCEINAPAIIGYIKEKVDLEKKHQLQE